MYPRSFSCKSYSDQNFINFWSLFCLFSFEKKWFHEGCLKDKPKNYMFEGVPFFDTFLGDPDVIMPMTITVTRFSAAFIMFTVGLLIAGLVLAGEIWWARKRGIAVSRSVIFCRGERQDILGSYYFMCDPFLDAACMPTCCLVLV